MKSPTLGDSETSRLNNGGKLKDNQSVNKYPACPNNASKNALVCPGIESFW